LKKNVSLVGVLVDVLNYDGTYNKHEKLVA